MNLTQDRLYMILDGSEHKMVDKGREFRMVVYSFIIVGKKTKQGFEVSL